VRVIRKTVEAPSVQTTFRFHHLTDLHHGAKGHATDALDERIAEIAADPFALWGGGGDYADLISWNDKRFQPGMLPEDSHEHLGRLFDFSLDTLATRLAPIADKCCFLGDGNHERSWDIKFHRGFTAELARRLDLDRYVLGYRGWSVLNFQRANSGGRMPVKIFQYHGWSGGRLKGRKALQAERDIGAFDADIICLGHDHQAYADIFYTHSLRSSGGSWMPFKRPRVIVNGGSWVGETEIERERTADDPVYSTSAAQWAVTKNFRAEGIGGPIVDIHVDFGNGKNEKIGAKGRPGSVSYEIRRRS
jgi:hypothetical protein